MNDVGSPWPLECTLSLASCRLRAESLARRLHTKLWASGGSFEASFQASTAKPRAQPPPPTTTVKGYGAHGLVNGHWCAASSHRTHMHECYDNLDGSDSEEEEDEGGGVVVKPPPMTGAQEARPFLWPSDECKTLSESMGTAALYEKLTQIASCREEDEEMEDEEEEDEEEEDEGSDTSSDQNAICEDKIPVGARLYRGFSYEQGLDQLGLTNGGFVDDEEECEEGSDNFKLEDEGCDDNGEAKGEVRVEDLLKLTNGDYASEEEEEEDEEEEEEEEEQEEVVEVVKLTNGHNECEEDKEEEKPDDTGAATLTNDQDEDEDEDEDDDDDTLEDEGEEMLEDICRLTFIPNSDDLDGVEDEEGEEEEDICRLSFIPSSDDPNGVEDEEEEEEDICRLNFIPSSDDLDDVEDEEEEEEQEDMCRLSFIPSSDDLDGVEDEEGEEEDMCRLSFIPSSDDLDGVDDEEEEEEEGEAEVEVPPAGLVVCSRFKFQVTPVSEQAHLDGLQALTSDAKWLRATADDSTEDEDEEDGIRRRQLWRSTSLKSGKTPPGTPRRKKIVRFADALGLDLEAVRHIVSDDLPTVPASAFSDLKLEPTRPSPSIGAPVQLGRRRLCPQFAQPATDPRFLDRVRTLKVSLENVVVSSLGLYGVVRVLNMGFEKSVSVRYTTDDWRSRCDLTASYVDGSHDGFSDRFRFTLQLPDLPAGSRMVFAVKYTSQGQELWDNNDGKDYILRCVELTRLSGADADASDEHLSFV